MTDFSEPELVQFNYIRRLNIVYPAEGGGICLPFCIWEGHGDLTALYTDFYLLIMPSVFSPFLTLNFSDTIPFFFFFLVQQGELILLLLSIFIIGSLYPFALLSSLFVFHKFLKSHLS